MKAFTVETFLLQFFRGDSRCVRGGRAYNTARPPPQMPAKIGQLKLISLPKETA